MSLKGRHANAKVGGQVKLQRVLETEYAVNAAYDAESRNMSAVLTQQILSSQALEGGYRKDHIWWPAVASSSQQ